jgi:ubiquitin-protein ligase
MDMFDDQRCQQKEHMTDQDYTDKEQKDSDDVLAQHSAQQMMQWPSGAEVPPGREPRANNTTIATYTSDTASGHTTLNSFAQFTHHLKTEQCRVCKERFFSSELDVYTLIQNWMDGVVDNLSCNIKCKRCGTSSCIGCTPQPYSKASRIDARHKSQKVSWCCVSGRLFLIWVLLCGLDRHLSKSTKINKTAKPDRTQRSLQTSRHSKGDNESASSFGTGYGGTHATPHAYMPKGMGYSASFYDYDTSNFSDSKTQYDQDYEYFFDPEEQVMISSKNGFVIAPGNIPGQPKPSSAEDEEGSMSDARRTQIIEDNFSSLILGFLTDLLPSSEREACFDRDPPAAVLDMLAGSRILKYCAELLRNGSLVDIIKRKDLYEMLFGFLVTLGLHPATRETLFGVRSMYPGTADLLTISFSAPLSEQKEKTPALAECLRDLSIQSSLVLRNAKKCETDFETDDGRAMLSICEQVSGLAKFIQANNPSCASEKQKSEAPVMPADLPIQSVDEEEMLPTYRYARDAKGLEASEPGRFKRLITEITTLQTGLPPGIVVRYCENRPDILKCIIIGPVGTPYENGIFEFDIFCGKTFPITPPIVNFKGTGGGRISINPNLYADGMVCLSLLGTWAGESWNPRESTLLQVLISIQAMILCEEPWYNEPGRESSYTRLASGGPSDRYNRKTREHTVRYAILGWLNKTPELWKDVVTYHFTEHGNDILKKVEEWVSEEAKIPLKPMAHMRQVKTHMSSLVSTLQAKLEEYGTTYKIHPITPPPPPPPPPEPPALPQRQPKSQPSSSVYMPVPPPYVPYHLNTPAYPSAFPSLPHGSPNAPPFYYPCGMVMPGGQAIFGGGSPSGPVPGPSFLNPPPPDLFMVNSWGPPSSNTRSAAQGRASSSGGDTGTFSGQGGPSQGLPINACSSTGDGRGLSDPVGGNSSKFFAGTTGGGRGRGRGRGRGDQGNRGGHGGRSMGA